MGSKDLLNDGLSAALDSDGVSWGFLGTNWLEKFVFGCTSIKFSLKASLNIGLHFAHVNLGSSVVSGSKHLSLWRIFGSLKSSIFSFLFLFFLSLGLFNFFLLNHSLVIFFCIIQLLLFSLRSFMFLLLSSFWGSHLINHSWENTLTMEFVGNSSFLFNLKSWYANVVLGYHRCAENSSASYKIGIHF